MDSRFRTAILATLAAAICLNLPQQAQSRNPWDIQHPTLPPDQDGTYVPGQMPGQLHKGMPPQLSKDFWKGGQYPSFTNNVQAGTMLTGVLETELSSAKSKPGDTFAIRLDDGFVQNGMQVIPQKSKIVGSVTAVAPAKTQRHGMPGNLQVSLQSLVLPDGTHMPFSGFIAVNPNHTYKNPPKARNLGFDIRDTGNQVKGMFGSLTNGIGFMHAKMYRGNDFYMDEGESMPIRLNRALVMPEGVVKPIATAPGPAYQMPPGMVPGLAGPDTIGQYRPPVPVQPVPGLVGDADPFKVPVNPAAKSSPLSEMPEPF